MGGTQLVSYTHACTCTPYTCHRKLALGLLQYLQRCRKFL